MRMVHETRVGSASAYDELRALLRNAQTLASIGALLEWDQETMMPAQAAPFRAEEVGMIAALVHERITHPRVGELLATAEADPDLAADPAALANVREIRRDHDRATRLPTALVAEMSETNSRALEVWKVARQDSDFQAFRPWLARQVELHRREAECYGPPPGGELYDALLEDYEPGMRSAEVEGIFQPLRRGLAPLIAEIAASGPGPSLAPQELKVAVEAQQAFNRAVAQAVGYDFDAGRLDVSTHPFTTGMAPGDTRITTRYSDDQFADALGSTLHEVGHALYEQGLPKAERHGEPLAEAASLGIHESQSRMWENQVGRSHAFWTWAMPVARRMLGPDLERFSVDDVYQATNAVRPHLTRVESDEATYNLHVMLRFDIERALIRGDLEAGDVPSAWNDRMKQDLGLDVPDDRRGCLQDVHWSGGMIGYFPTYALGNLYAAQFWQAVEAEMPDLQACISDGNFGVLLGWLRRNVHAHGRRYSAPELCRRITGRPLSHQPLLDYLRNKLAPIYRL